MLVRPIIYDNQMPRALSQGDALSEGTVLTATDTTNTNLTITGQMLLSGVITRNPAGVSNENIDTASNLITAFQAATSGPLQQGTAFRVRWINLSANILTVVAAANTGLVLTRGNIPVSTIKDFLITVANATPAQTFAAMTTNASAVITNLSAAQTALLSPGMIVLNAVNGLQGTTILSVQPGTGVTLSGNANATSVLPGVSIQFSPVVQIVGLGL